MHFASGMAGAANCCNLQEIMAFQVVYWVAIKEEPNLSYYIGETLVLILYVYIYIHP